MQQLFSSSELSFLVTLLVVSAVNAVIVTMGGTGFLVPFMIMCGVHPAMALGTARVAALSGWALAAKKFYKAGQIRKDRLLLVTLISVVAGIAGTYLLLGIDEKYVYPVVGLLLVAMAPLALLRKDFGIVVKKRGAVIEAVGYVAFFFVMIYGGFLGNGTTAMAVFVAITFWGFRSLEAHATLLVGWVVMSVFSSAIFMYHGQVDYLQAVAIFLGTLTGSHIGAHYAIKGGDKWVKGVVFIFSIIVGVQLLYMSWAGA